MKILVAIDHSPFSQAALQWVRRQPWPEGSLITVVSAVQVSTYALVEPAGAGLYDQLAREQELAHESLVARARGDLAQAGLSVTERVERGDPREVIVRVAEAERPDLVVVGSHGRTGLAHLLLGSVASHVVSHAPGSVLVVKSPPAPAGGRKEGPS